MDQPDRERFFSMGEVYDRMCQRLVPQYDWLHGCLVDMLQERLPQAPLIVDLGAGSGILLEKLLNAFPRARGVWMDYSHDFLGVARKRLEPVADRITFVHAAFADPWEQQLPAPPDAIVSMSAIHHLPDTGKRQLYGRCLDALAPGGWFFNIDEMRAHRDDAYLRSMEQWVEYVDRARSTLPVDELAPYEEWMQQFSRWRQRNLSRFGQPKQEGDDLHASYWLQLEMLDSLGFVETDLFTKHHLFCMIGGMKS
jgi:tRNA (cmo5U34)-methyltransferase